MLHCRIWYFRKLAIMTPTRQRGRDMAARGMANKKSQPGTLTLGLESS